MRTGILRGRDHARLERIAAVADGPAAIALSMGGARKVYAHADPNEDAAGFAVGAGGALVVVADGHRGCDASEVAVDVLIARHAARFVGESAIADFAGAAGDAFRDLRDAIALRVAGSEREGARTTLAFALVRPRDGVLAYASAGDSHIFRIDGATALEIGFDESVRSRYLGAAELADGEPDPWIARCESLAGARAVVLATDGLSETGIGVDVPSAAVSDAVHAADAREAEMRPLETARGVVATALAAHARNRSGDNAACAVVFVEDGDR